MTRQELYTLVEGPYATTHHRINPLLCGLLWECTEVLSGLYTDNAFVWALFTGYVPSSGWGVVRLYSYFK